MVAELLRDEILRVESSSSNLNQVSLMKNQTVDTKPSGSSSKAAQSSDVTIVVGGNEIRADNKILVARSPVFASLLLTNGTSNNYDNSSIIKIHDVEPKVFIQLMRCIYTNKVDDIDDTMAKDLSVAAFWPKGNESFKWDLQLFPQSRKDSTYMELYLNHRNIDTVNVNFTLNIGSEKINEVSYTFEGIIGLGWSKFIKRDEAFKSCLPDGNLIINCEIRAIPKTVEVSGQTSSSQQVSINNQTYSRKMADDFFNLLEDENFSDITIVVEQNEIRAHKAILAARSPVFASLIMENSSVANCSGNSSTIEVKDVKPKIFKKLLQYIYTDKVDGIDSTIAKDLLVAAITYDLKQLKATCENILYNSIGIDNAVEILDIADQYYIPALRSQAKNFLIEHRAFLMHTSAFKKLIQSKPHLISEVLTI
ncbi:TD and POZ domain-containing protein 5 [Nasonia vitripennis]|uniref:Roadkill n=1 Tax=Nasonia vitripennis TaxID=7425 RepID=A0A7M7IZT5_NASVI|nr:TD and POZ domain-containing protein 5 [Nasonia vitripennis]